MRNLETINGARSELSAQAVEQVNKLQSAIETVIKGKSEPVRLAIVTLIAGGHLLVEDVPGVGKTTLAHAMARALDCSFQRVQFTSDLLPSDVIGLSVTISTAASLSGSQVHICQHHWRRTINRTTPKTQSACLKRWPGHRSRSRHRHSAVTGEPPKPY